jgi:hypothetical protein
MPADVFDQLQTTLQAEGPQAAIDRLCDRLRAEKNYADLFYALLMKKRHALGASPVPTSPHQELPREVQTELEEGIREAAREVGGLHLKDRNIAQAWSYFRLIEEPGPVRAALEAHSPGEEDDLQPLIQVSFYEGLSPRRGFDWLLERYGICSAITTLSSQELPFPDEDKHYCIRKLVRALHAELFGRIVAEIEAREGQPPLGAGQPAGTPGVLPALFRGRDWLFEEDSYHVDLSHLSSVVQMSLHLPPCPELALARELCEYGRRLSGKFVQPGDPPFEELYPAHDAYLAILQGDDVERHLAYFRAQAEKADPEEVGTYPAEVLVNLLVRLGRPGEALAVARKYLSKAEGRLSCPGVGELCEKVKDYRALAEVARERGDAVHYLAGLIAARG